MTVAQQIFATLRNTEKMAVLRATEDGLRYMAFAQFSTEMKMRGVEDDTHRVLVMNEVRDLANAEFKVIANGGRSMN